MILIICSYEVIGKNRRSRAIQLIVKISSQEHLQAGSKFVVAKDDTLEIKGGIESYQPFRSRYLWEVILEVTQGLLQFLLYIIQVAGE